jgi:hypothetical protein
MYGMVRMRITLYSEEASWCGELLMARYPETRKSQEGEVCNSYRKGSTHYLCEIVELRRWNIRLTQCRKIGVKEVRGEA